MINSPCRGVCTNLFDDVCKGCGRTDVEIFEWNEMADEGKRIVWKRLLATEEFGPKLKDCYLGD